MTAPRGRERLKFLEFEFANLPDGNCRARVVLEGEPGQRFTGEAEGLGSRTGQLRCSAEAATRALRDAVAGRMSFELLGVKAVRAFDAMVIIVSLSQHNGEPARRVVGSCLTEESENRCAALAVLNATNRLLGNAVFMR
jgi:hypothetical protein